MKRKATSSRVELKVTQLTPARANDGQQLVGSPKRSGSESPSSSSSSSLMSSSSSSDMSIDGSCVSSEAEEITTTSPPREAAPMVLVGCPRCLMYVMLSEANPKCPRCQSTVLLDFLNDQNFSGKTDD